MDLRLSKTKISDDGVLFKKAKRVVASAKKRRDIYLLLHDYVKVSPNLSDIFSKLFASKKDQGDPSAVFFEYVDRKIHNENYSPIQALSDLLPGDEVLLIKSSSSSELADAFQKAEHWAYFKAQFKGAIIGAVAYPTFSATLALIALYFSLRHQVPLLSSMGGADLPQMKPLLFLHTIFVENIFLTMLAMLGFVAWVMLYSLKCPPDGHRHYVDGFPPWSVQRQFQAGACLISLSNLLDRRKTFPDAIRLIEKDAPVYLKSWLGKVIERLEGNLSPANSLDVQLFDKDTIFAIKDFAGKPSFTSVIRDIAHRNLNKLKGTLQGFAVVFSVALMISNLGINAYTVVVSSEIQATIQAQYK